MPQVLASLPKRSLIVLFASLSLLTSPKCAVRLLWALLCKTPYLLAKRIIQNLLPALCMKSVSRDTVLITGGASGTGKLLAIKFARLGAKVALLDINAEAVEQAARDVAKDAQAAKGNYEHVYHFTADLSDRAATYEAMDKVKQQLGEVSILVNNAGIVTGKKLLETPDESIDLTMRVNTDAHFWTIKALLPNMIAKNHGHIVTLASSAGLTGVPGLVDYCASKWGAVGTNESLRAELRKLGKTGVKTTCVCPFFIKTGMFEGAKTKWPRLVPLLEPEFAVERIMQAVRCNQELLVMPFAVHLTFLAKLLPVPVMDDLAVALGINEAMDDFKGRT